jgi:hypothetical protein
LSAKRPEETSVIAEIDQDRSGEDRTVLAGPPARLEQVRLPEGLSVRVITVASLEYLMRKAEKLLRVVVQDLVGVCFGQSQPLDIGEGFFVGLVILQYRVVAAGH